MPWPVLKSASESRFGRTIVLIIVVAVGGTGLVAVPQQPVKPAQSSSPQAAPPPASSTPASPSAPVATGAPPASVSLTAARQDAWNCLKDGVAAKDYDHRAAAIAALGTAGGQPSVVRLVESGLDDSKPIVREAAAAALGEMKSRGSIPKLRAALDDRSAIVIYAAAQALWKMGDKSAANIFIEILQGDRHVSTGMIRQGLQFAHEQLHNPTELAELGASQAAGAFLGPGAIGVDMVVEMTKDSAAPAQAISAQLLGGYPDPAVHESLQDALEDKSPIVRAAAAEALGRQGDSSDIAKLMPLLKDNHRIARFHAAAAILRITSRRGS